MTIKIEITGEDAQAVATQLLVLGSLITQKIGGRPSEQQAVEPEILEPKKAAPKKAQAKKVETIEHEPTPETEPEQPDQDETVETEAELPDQDDNATKPMSIDELRSYTISNYLAEVYPKREDQKGAFKKLLDHFEIEKLGDLPEDQAVSFKAEVDARIAKAGEK